MMVSIIILNWNGMRYIDQCILSISKQTYKDYEIIAVDNGSTDGSEHFVKENYPFVNLLCLNQNYGFCKGNNIGFKVAKGEYIAILNNDTELEPNWLENVVKAFESNENTTFITSKIISFHNREVFDDVGDVILPSGKAYKIGNGEIDKGQYDTRKFIFGASGCASVYKREFFDKVGYFDEDFFAYLEDIDLSFRANLLGLRCLYVPDAIVYHIGSATTGSKYNHFTVFYLAQNTINIIVKNYPLGILFKSFFCIVGRIAALQVFFIVKGFGIDYFRGIISGLGMIKKMKFKRKKILSERVLSNKELDSLFKENIKLYKISKANRQR